MAMSPIKRGFTLIELAIALAIVGLLLGGLSVPLSKRLAEQQYAETQASIDKAMEALVGFALLNGRLPCPDISTTIADNRDGLEDGPGALTCLAGANTVKINFTNSSDATGASWGDLPWKTLGLSPPNNADAWNNRLRYAVFTQLAIDAPGNITTAAMLDIRCAEPTRTTVSAVPMPAPSCLPLPPAATTYSVIQNAAFVVYSAGANGYGATSINSASSYNPFDLTKNLTNTPIPDQFANAPEKESTIALRRQFVVRERTDASSNSGEYDDLLSFMSSNKLASRLLNAGLWP
jgi:prepilin-type N-terminal cleavage/methylation domain-containing protein